MVTSFHSSNISYKNNTEYYVKNIIVISSFYKSGHIDYIGWENQ